MSTNTYNAQRQGNQDHLHTQDETDKANLKKVNAKEKIKEQPAKEKAHTKSTAKTYKN